MSTCQICFGAMSDASPHVCWEYLAPRRNAKAAPAISPRQQVLDTAKDAVLRDRNDTHGEPENTFAAIADLWDAYDAANKGKNGREHDVAMKLELVKVARIACGAPAHLDNYADGSGYFACAYELAVAHKEKGAFIGSNFEAPHAD